MKKVSEFVKEVKSEMTKVTWATRKETMTTTLAVFVMVFIAALFFLLIDWIFSSLIKVIL
jgi:preprotein translocase subunit SecE